MKKEQRKLLLALIKLQDKSKQLYCDSEVTYHISAAVQRLTNQLNK